VLIELSIYLIGDPSFPGLKENAEEIDSSAEGGELLKSPSLGTAAIQKDNHARLP